MDVKPFLVFGDNLEECHRFCETLIKNVNQSDFRYLGDKGNIPFSTYVFEHEEGDKIAFRISGRYKDWNRENRPYIGEEDPDIILTDYEEDEIVFASEFNEAISAGNNAWQRYPRVSQAARSNIPFLYTVPITDAEIYDGDIRSFRHPNTIFQIAQLILMSEEQTPSLTLYSDNPWTDRAVEEDKTAENISTDNWEQTYSDFVFSLLSERLGHDSNLDSSIETGISNMIEFIHQYTSDFDIIEDEEFHNNIEETTSLYVDFLTGEGENPANEISFLNKYDRDDIISKSCFFNKTVTTDSKYKNKINPWLNFKKSDKKSEIEEFARFWGVNDVRANEDSKKEMLRKLHEPERSKYLPLSYNENNVTGFIYNVEPFSNLISDNYRFGEIGEIRESESILFLPIAGYVMDTGGPAFSRPDKGLVRLVNDLFGGRIGETNVVLLYNQLVPEDWKERLNAAKESKENGTNNLWREIEKFADVVIVDKSEEYMIL